MLLENAERGADLRMILVQSDEPVVARSAAAAAGFDHVAQLTRARIRAAIEALNAQGPAGSGEDRGFRAARLSPGK